MVITAAKNGIKTVFVPTENAAEGSVVQGIEVIPVRSVEQLIKHLRSEETIAPAKFDDFRDSYAPDEFAPDFRDVRGQAEVKRALEIAAAGGHNIIMVVRPARAKKYVLAKRLPSILPDMTFEESLETTKLYSVAGALPEGVSLMTQRPFRSPHHTVSPAGLSGGGTIPRPGEISLAHNGVLFFRRAAGVFASGDGGSAPADGGLKNNNFARLRVAVVPVLGDDSLRDESVSLRILRPPDPPVHLHPAVGSAISFAPFGPLLDRLDIHIEVPPVEFASLSGTSQEECSADIRKRVNAARAIQTERLKGSGISCNAKMDAAQTKKFCRPTPEGHDPARKSVRKSSNCPRGRMTKYCASRAPSPISTAARP